MPQSGVPRLPASADVRITVVRRHSSEPGPSGDGRRADGRCQGAGRGRQMPARAKPAADALDLTPTPDARGDLRRLPSVAPRQHLPALYSVATDGRSGPGRRVTAGAAVRLYT